MTPIRHYQRLLLFNGIATLGPPTVFLILHDSEQFQWGMIGYPIITILGGYLIAQINPLSTPSERRMEEMAFNFPIGGLIATILTAIPVITGPYAIFNAATSPETYREVSYLPVITGAGLGQALACMLRLRVKA